jgi:3-oxoacyl-[acyl-carrier-protein] synthase-1
LATVDVVLAGLGLMTPVGATATETSASVRSATARFSESPIHDRRSEPFTLAVVPDDVLPPLAEAVVEKSGLTSRVLRMIRLATMPLRAVIAAVPKHAPLPGLVLALPETETTIPMDGQAMLDTLAVQAPGTFDRSYSMATHRGRAGGLLAIEHAASIVRDGRVPFMIAGGVDTYRDLYVLGTLDREKRVKSAANLDGFIPGEGAAFVLVANARRAVEFGVAPLVALTALTSGFESGHLYSEEVYRGDGLAAAVSAAVAQAGTTTAIPEVYSSMNGESHWAKEWSVAYLRNRGAFHDAFRIHHPADCYGDLGAAAGPALVALAASGMKGGYRQSPGLVYASSDRGARAVALVSPIG